MVSDQFNLKFDPDGSPPPLELLSPHDIWERISQEDLPRYSEDRRIELKSVKINLSDLAKYFSMFSNTSPEGGVILIGVRDHGEVEGCSSLSRISHIDHKFCRTECRFLV